jgi:FMN reductase
MQIVSVVGNPKARGKTSDATAAVADLIAANLPAPVTATVIELADLGPKLLGWGDEDVAAALASVYEADVLIVASPTYKATYTGLLKLFLDQIPAGRLGATLTVPLMVGGAPNHALAVETHLRPVLVELGAAMPTAGLYLLESQLADLQPVLEPWWAASSSVVARCLGLAEELV